MSENKPRAVGEIQQEYQGLCVRAGHIQYQIATMAKDLDLLNNTMRDLNFEAAASQVEAAKAAEAKASDSSASLPEGASNGA